MPLCLIVEDAPQQRAILDRLLCSQGYETVTADRAATARALCAERRPEVVLLDLGLPDADGLDLIPELLRLVPLCRIVVLTGFDSVRVAVEALRAGACHYLVKPWDREELLLVVAREARSVAFSESRARAGAGDVFWGHSAALGALRARLERLASSPLTPVLVEAETGAGKEVVARELHRLSRAGGPFVPLNCAAVPAELLESELFGHERGAFTGAEARRRGVVELARDGTLFLDEIGEMALPLQAKLLRFLEDHRFRRLGGEELLASPCRVVAATHQEVEALQAQGRFRPDLFFRLAVVRLRVPSLRERPEDLLALSHFLLDRLSRALGRPARPLSPAAERALCDHQWPGNVRELRNRLERALVLGETDRIQPEDLDLDRRGSPEPPAPPPLEASNLDPEALQLRRLLEQERWCVARLARRMGLPRHRLKYRIAKLGLSRTAKP